MHIYRHQFNKDQSKTHFKCCYKYSKRNGFNLYNLFSTESYLINDIFFIKDGLENEKKKIQRVTKSVRIREIVIHTPIFFHILFFKQFLTGKNLLIVCTSKMLKSH